MKTLIAGLAFVLLILSLSIAAFRGSGETLKQQSGVEFCAYVGSDNCACDPSPGIIVEDRRGKEHEADWNCHCWVVK